MDPKDFKPGTYRHFKGGTYVALGLITHHHNRRPMVRYLDKDGTENARPLEAWPEDPSGWTDTVEHEGRKVQRFEPIEEAEALYGIWTTDARGGQAWFTNDGVPLFVSKEEAQKICNRRSREALTSMYGDIGFKYEVRPKP